MPASGNPAAAPGRRRFKPEARFCRRILMARRARRGNRTAIRLGAAVGVAVVTALVLAAGRARLDPPAPKAAVLVTATKHPAAAPATTGADPRGTTTTTRPATTTTGRATTTTRPAPPNTSTTRAAPTTTTTTVRTRATCLALADANHYTVLAANNQWFQEQLHGLSPDPAVAARQYDALRIEESWALKEIDAQYAIDRSNCYLE